MTIFLGCLNRFKTTDKS